jgi:hypothetical protein
VQPPPAGDSGVVVDFGGALELLAEQLRASCSAARCAEDVDEARQ